MAVAANEAYWRRMSSELAVLPVVTIEDVSQTRQLVSALAEGGLGVVEIALRTDCALDAIRVAAKEGVRVGAGTVRTAVQARAAVDAGAEFVVAPGATGKLAKAVEALGVPFLPGAATVSEMMRLRERGYRFQKFFPAEAAGGISMLRSVSAVLPEVAFCPTGGIGPTNLDNYLALPNVWFVGGSWITPADRIAVGDWRSIRRLAEEATAKRKDMQT